MPMIKNGTDAKQLSELVGEELVGPFPAINDILTKIASERANELALACLHQPSTLFGIAKNSNESHLRWTFSQLQTAVDRLVVGLQQYGLRAGQSLATFIPNGAEWVMLMWATHRLGCPFIPLNPRSIKNQEELDHLFRIGKVQALVVDDVELAAQVERMLPEQSKAVTLKVTLAEEPPQGWKTFGNLMDSGNADITHINGSHAIRDEDDVILILFTSGTTSLPKGCPLTNINLSSILHAYSRLPNSYDKDSRLCLTLPNNHVICYLFAMFCWGNGGAVIFPSGGFQAHKVLDALVEEECTHFHAVPTAILSIMEEKANRGIKLKYLRNVGIGGSNIPHHVLRGAVKELESQRVYTLYGMTEGVPLWTDSVENPDDLIEGDNVKAGNILPGMKIRICEPGTRRLVPVGQHGEIHQAGPQLIKGYIAKDDEAFYTDETGTSWLATGDQAVMYDQNRVYVTGRYKDMIIRGGENIAPSLIESVINTFPDLDAYVVGAPDDFAGEVPVAVVATTSAPPTKDIQRRVIERLGTMYTPDEIVTLNQLGFDEYPQTTSGKVQKTALASVVHEYRSNRSNETIGAASAQSQMAIISSLWSQVLGIPQEELDHNVSLFSLVDSIAAMSFRAALRKETGVSFSMQDLNEYDTIESQANALKSRNEQEPGQVQHLRSVREGPPTAKDMIHTTFNESKVNVTQKAVEQVLAPFGLGWSDVENVIPVYDFLNNMLLSGGIDRVGWQMCMLVHGHEIESARKALENALFNHPLFTSFNVCLDESTAEAQFFYVTVKQNQKLLKHCIFDGGALKTTEEFQSLAGNFPSSPGPAEPPGPLFKAMIYEIESPKSVGFLFSFSHRTFDATSQQIFFEDLDLLLGPKASRLRPRIDYKLWADTFYSLRYSLAADAAVDWYMRHFANVQAHRKALYPTGVPRQYPPSESRDGETIMRFPVPNIFRFRDRYPGVMMATVVKSAWLLMATYVTQTTHVLSRGVENGRGTWPFLPASLATVTGSVLESADVAGPMFHAMPTVVDVLSNASSETVASYTHRMQELQTALTANAIAPWRRIIDALGTKVDKSGAGDIVTAIGTIGWSFNWIPNLEALLSGKASGFDHMRMLCAKGGAPEGFTTAVGLSGSGSDAVVSVRSRWSRADISNEEAEHSLNVFRKCLDWVLEETNWEKPLEGYKKGIEG